MRVVLDCNVVIAAARTDGVCRAAVLAAIRRCEIVLSEAIVEEYREVAERPKHRSCLALASAFVDALEMVAVVATPEALPELPDPDDAIYLAAATDGAASVLVTGNARHFPQAMCGTVTVLSPAAFLELLAASED